MVKSKVEAIKESKAWEGIEGMLNTIWKKKGKCEGNQTRKGSELEEDEDEVGRPWTLPRRIICLGLGSPKDSRVAQFQLALLLIFRDHVDEILRSGSTSPNLSEEIVVDRLEKVSGGQESPKCSVEAFDPIFDREDRDLLSYFGVQAPLENKVGDYPVQEGEPTLFYMPHCGLGLYERVLRSNWSTERLAHLLLCCNELENYRLGMRDSELKESYPCVHRFVNRIESKRLPNLAKPNSDCFNDTAFQRFVGFDKRGGEQGGNDPEEEFFRSLSSGNRSETMTSEGGGEGFVH
ncbi:hypothetical protein IE53DRAFT_371378 [Violaceomyces palustris]|uniref:Uncharacterized protein n=1 Tax=Violaceomyces palustris TaxID=1673888 RepID=A0ACD0NP21_9BASI|nr:hypothetical protein IE53DRAFT_371378 [Violaceomyces palustris]